MREIPVSGAKLAAEVAGAGENCVVLLHGLASDRRDWDFAWPELAVDRRAIRYDLRGFGASASWDRGAFRHSEDLAGLLDSLQIERCDLAGISLGGSVALNYSLDHPERVRRLALVSPGLTAWDWSPGWRIAWREIASAAQAGERERARELWFAHPLFATTRALPGAARILRETVWAYSGQIWADGDREPAALPDLDRLPDLRAPTLLLTGSADLPDFRLIADLIEGAAPAVRRVDYEGCGHMLNLERPAEIRAELCRFLACELDAAEGGRPITGPGA